MCQELSSRAGAFDPLHGSEVMPAEDPQRASSAAAFAIGRWRTGRLLRRPSDGFARASFPTIRQSDSPPVHSTRSA